MKFSQLKRRVEHGEALVEGRLQQTIESHGRLQRDWRQAWTPLRILVAGLATGFIAGRAEPEKTLKKLGSISGPRTLQLVTSVAGLVGSVQAAIAALAAKDAADTAGDAASETADVASGPAAAAPATDPQAAGPAEDGTGSPWPGTASDRPRRPDPHWDRQPSPAEAATDVSER